MKIEIEAKIILTVPVPKKEESVEDIAFGIERKLNELGVLYTPEHYTRVAIRAHFIDAQKKVN